MSNCFRILALGDVCGPRAVEYLSKSLWSKRRELNVDMVIANGENSAEPNGIDKESAIALFEGGVDVITTGNHIWRKSGVFRYLDDEERILRPLNFPSQNPGHGACVVKINGYSVLVMNVMGCAYTEADASPFEAVERAFLQNEGRYDLAVLDIHAESTGEKKAIAYDFCDKLSACFGTHTHVQTNDAQILMERCAYITDLGMTGAKDSILGVKKEAVIHKMKTKMLSRFDFADGDIEAQGAIFDINTDTGKAVSCQTIKF
ncbi:MAG: YmdB family metallophosphoesterase [Clostridia bacterium]|nr:YmdB family metallophosphoesterase [Clostridia bacterium]